MYVIHSRCMELMSSCDRPRAHAGGDVGMLGVVIAMKSFTPGTAGRVVNMKDN